MKYFKIAWLLLCFIMLSGSLCKKQLVSTKEARGLWVTRWEWAIQTDSNRVETQQQRIIEIFEQANQAKINFILFQIRGNGDAFYRSEYEPWSHLLSGELGANPGWDPLEFAINQAHSRSLELHAWFNTFPAWRGKTPPPHTEPEQVINAHPDWLICDRNGVPMKLNDGYVSLSPGIPAVRQYITDVALDIVNKYDIDGFHFDYIRYPEFANRHGYSHDPVSVALFGSPAGNPDGLNWEDWQRENINQFVRNFYDQATAQKPYLKISAAVIGRYNYSQWNGYHVVFQDAKKWLSEGKMDFIVPMIYWQTNHSTAPFGEVTRDWLVNFYHKRYVFPGMMINRLGSDKWPRAELLKQIEITRKNDGNGMIFFSSTGIDSTETQLEIKGFPHRANFPPMSWKDDQPPMDPANVRAEFVIPGLVKLSWDAPDSRLEPTDIRSYNIFRSGKKPFSRLKPSQLYHIVAGTENVFYDVDVKYGKTYFYIVTALDRVNNESPPSNEVWITIPIYAEQPESDKDAGS